VLEHRWIVPHAAAAAARKSNGTLVFLHEGLGSVRMWRDFPAVLADRTGCRAFVYSRQGHGDSPPLTAPRTVRFMHDEAVQVLPRVLEQFDIDDPILIGHSDGASIALIHAGAAARPPRALVLLAPHVFVEDVSVRSIARMRELYATTDLRERLARYHADVDGMFRGWNDIWLDPAFRAWNIEEYLPRITCPVLVVQGEDDEYGTVRQVEAVAAQVRGRVEILLLARCGHSPHRDQQELVVERIAGFLAAT
jgi:pimeloyl-ACP methyl ester carboxylesterase